MREGGRERGSEGEREGECEGEAERERAVFYIARNILQSGGGGYICVQYRKIIVHFAYYLRVHFAYYLRGGGGATRNDSDAILRASNPKQ